MKLVYLVFPDQLFDPYLDTNDINRKKIYLYEHPYFFTNHPYHKMKLLFLREAMVTYQRKYEADYLPYDYDISQLFIKEKELHIFRTHTMAIKIKLKEIERCYGVKFIKHPNPVFMSNKTRFKTFLPFYIDLRAKHDILCDKNGPDGGSWQYKLKQKKRLPYLVEPSYYESITCEDSKHYIADCFGYNFGDDSQAFFTDDSSAQDYFQTYCQNRLDHYSEYNEIITTTTIYGHGPNIAFLLNVGLLTYKICIDTILKYTNLTNYKNAEYFIRQLLYNNFLSIKERNIPAIKKHSLPLNQTTTLRRKRALELLFSNKSYLPVYDYSFFGGLALPQSWYNGSTGLGPFDFWIRKLWTCGYATNLERKYILMFMLMARYKGQDIYDWFMSMFIDSNDTILLANMGVCRKTVENGKKIGKFFKEFSDYRFMIKLWNSLFYLYLNNNRPILSNDYSLANDYIRLNKMSGKRIEAMKTLVRKWKLASRSCSRGRPHRAKSL